jgi:hypothetical protein
MAVNFLTRWDSVTEIAGRIEFFSKNYIHKRYAINRIIYILTHILLRRSSIAIHIPWLDKTTSLLSPRRFYAQDTITKCLCVCSLNETTTVCILDLVVHESLQWADMEVIWTCRFGKDKVCLNFPQDPSKLLPIRDVRRSYTRYELYDLRILESCLWNFECFNTVISYGIS